MAASNKRVLRFLLLLRLHCVKLSTFFTWLELTFVENSIEN